MMDNAGYHELMRRKLWIAVATPLLINGELPGQEFAAYEADKALAAFDARFAKPIPQARA